MSATYDVGIVGAGPGGSAAAYFLARQGLRVVVFDKAEFPRDKTCGDALTPRAVHMLGEMDVLRRLSAQRVTGMRIAAPNRLTTDVSLRAAGLSPDYALVIPRLELDDLLLRTALAAGAEFRASVRVESLEFEREAVVIGGLRKDARLSVRARAAIVATGASTRLLQRAGILERVPPPILATRAYFEGMDGLSADLRFHFDDVPLPGYGWVFPISATSANVGAGVLASQRANGKRVTGRAAYDEFVAGRSLAGMLHLAARVGPVKGFPIRTDFATAPTIAQRTLLVGEAAGLVNPLTGEGIDYALESGQTAARHIAGLFASGDFSRARLERYDADLRAQYQRLFEFSNRIRARCLSPFCLNLLLGWAARRPDLKTLLTRIMLGAHPVPERIGVRRVARVLLGV